jgi:CxxC-x17-CxxC domain-containing protein
MGDFRSFERERSEGRSFGRDSERNFGGRGRNFTSGGRGRSFGGGRDRRSMPACDAVCAKCGKNCQVPFKPTGDKPVYCSECFGAGAGMGRDGYRGPSVPVVNSSSNSGSATITVEQFKELNKKLDKILAILNSLEMVEDEEAATEDKDDGEDTEESESTEEDLSAKNTDEVEVETDSEDE